jgi:tetratricopeptide (TPR) repeat protein
VSHPDAEELAVYAEGRLPGAAATAVEAHLAICAECRDVVIDASADVADGRETGAVPPAAPVLPFRRRKVVIGVTAGLATAAAVLLAAWLTTGSSVSASLDGLVAVVNEEPTRALEGRLAGFRYAPTATVTRGAATAAAAPDVWIAAATVEKAAAGKSDAASLAATGLAHAVVGELDAAIAGLERAAAADANSALYYSDLSAVYLGRGRRDSRPADYEAALAAADRALAIDTSSPAACFNRALALDALARRDEAAAAWERCLVLEHDGAWAAEIRARLDSGR